MDWAAVLESEDRAQEALAFLRAADALPKGPREDPDLVERLGRLAIDLGMDVEAGRYRRRLKSIAPDRLRPIGERAATPARAEERAPEVRYRHAKFGVGTLVRREENGLRVRFDDGERVIVESRLEKL